MSLGDAAYAALFGLLLSLTALSIFLVGGISGHIRVRGRMLPVWFAIGMGSAVSAVVLPIYVTDKDLAVSQIPIVLLMYFVTFGSYWVLRKLGV